MYYSGFQSNAFQRNAFQIVGSVTPGPTILVTRGGFKKERIHNRSFKQTVKESLEELLGEPKVAEQVQEIVSEYSNSKNLSLSSIDFKLAHALPRADGDLQHAGFASPYFAWPACSTPRADH